jgi:hypothetical protein
MAEQKEKPCPYCQSVKNEFGTCSWHCMTCANKGNCHADNAEQCNYKHEEEKQNGQAE